MQGGAVGYAEDFKLSEIQRGPSKRARSLKRSHNRIEGVRMKKGKHLKISRYLDNIMNFSR